MNTEAEKAMQQAIESAPLEARERWYVEMNCWKRPDDFPVDLPEFANHADQSNDPTWRAAWRAVSSSITDEQASRAWWILELKRTEEEWRHWWNTDRWGRA